MSNASATRDAGDPRPELYRRLQQAVAQLGDRYGEVLPREAVAEIVQAAADAVRAPGRYAEADTGALAEQIVARAKADLALAVGVPVYGRVYAPAGDQATAWTQLLDGVAVVRAVGVFDLGTSAILRRELGRATDSGRRAVLVDLGRVSVMDTAGLAPLVMAARYARERGQRFLLVQVPAQVSRLIEVTGTARELGCGLSGTGERYAG